MNYDDMIAVLQAAKAGKPIQMLRRDRDDKWSDNGNPQWNFKEFDYRAKPEPREWWIAHTRGLVFSHKTNAEAVSLGGEVVHVREIID